MWTPPFRPSLHIQKTRRSGLWLMRVARGNRNGAGLPKRFTVRTRVGMKTLANFAMCKSHQSQEEQRTGLYLNMQMQL